MNDTEKLASALADLQTQFAFQEDTIAALNEALAGQQRELLGLQEEVQLLKQRLKEQGDALSEMAPPPTSERPPHY